MSNEDEIIQLKSNIISAKRLIEVQKVVNDNTKDAKQRLHEVEMIINNYWPDWRDNEDQHNTQ